MLSDFSTSADATPIEKVMFFEVIFATPADTKQASLCEHEERGGRVVNHFTGVQISSGYA